MLSKQKARPLIDSGRASSLFITPGLVAKKFVERALDISKHTGQSRAFLRFGINFEQSLQCINVDSLEVLLGRL